MNKIKKNEEITPIPIGWEVEKDFIKIKSGYGFKLKEYSKNGIPLIRIDNVSYGKITNENLCFLPQNYLEVYKEFVLKKGDILLALNRPITNNQLKIGKVNFESSILYQRVGRLEVNDNKFFLDFYYFYLQSPMFLKRLNTMLVGSDQPYIKSSDFSKIYFPVPPFQEQQKIASILSTVDDLIENTDHLINSYTLLKKGLMQTLSTKGIGHTRFKKTEIGEIPEEWEVKKLGEVILSCSNGITMQQNKNNIGIKVSRIETISNGYIDLNNVGYLNTSKDLNLYKLHVGDILFSNINSVKHIGKVAYVDKDYNLYHGMNLLRIIADNEIMLSKFLFYQLSSKRVKNWFRSNCKKAVNQASLSQSDISRCMVPIPPIQEQENIIYILSSVDDRLELYKSKKEKLNLLKKGLMQQLLTGRIRVKV